MILILDSVRSKENVGALFRTADAAGVTAVILCGITPCPINRFGVKDGKVAKSALGAEECMLWRYEEDCAKVVKELRRSGMYVYALEQTEHAVDYRTADILTTGALVVGNEVDGVSKKVLACVDGSLYIPMHGKKESLNVTTATGIALFSFL
jgi:23S rRNA (guanosine2251-2'-O)-methyltransferase